MFKKLSTTLACTLGSLFLTTAAIEAYAPAEYFNPMSPSYPEEMYCYHFASSLNYKDRTFQLEDGSEWKVADDDWMQFLSWRPNDYLVITPNLKRSDYGFYVTDQANKAYVRANLVNGPLVGGAYTMTIKGLDANTFIRKFIYLNNGTCWAVADSDFKMTDTWQANDPIIIGHNDEWFTWNRTILINVLTNTYVRARKL